MKRVMMISLLYLTELILTIAAVELRNISTPTDIIPCSQKFCKNQQEISCTQVFDECLCSPLSYRHDMLCAKLSANAVMFRSTKILSIKCTNPTQDLNRILQYFDRFVNILKPRYYQISNCCKERNYEECIGQEIDRNGTSVNILDLTVLPSNDILSKLVLRNNYIQVVKGRFSLLYKNLVWLMLSSNYLKNISGFLSGLVKLELLYVTRNQLEYLSKSDFQGLNSLQKLGLSHNKIRFIAADVFADLINLRDLNLGNNLIQTLPDSIFTRTTSLKTLLLSANKFTAIPFSIMRDLTNVTLNMSENCMSPVSTLSTQNNFVRISNFSCSHCCLTSTSTTLLSRITTSANFSHNHINTIDTKMLLDMSHLSEVDLSSSHITKFDVSWVNVSANFKQRVDSKNRLTTVVLSRSEINCDCHILPILHLANNSNWQPTFDANSTGFKLKIDKVTCVQPEALRGIMASDILLNPTLASKLVCKFTANCPLYCNCYTFPYVSLNVVNCSGRGLSSLPNVDIPVSDYFTVIHLEYNSIKTLQSQNMAFWYNLKEIYLDNNEIFSLDGLILGPMMSVISLRNNHLTDVQYLLNSLLSLSNVKQIWLSGNPWKCSCDLRDLKTSIITTGKVVDYEEMTCILDDEVYRLLNSSDYELCPILGSYSDRSLFNALVPTVVSCLVLCSILSMIAYKYKSVIKLWLFSHGYCLRLVTEDDLDATKIYDAFVSYSSDDDEWVNQNIVIELERGIPPYKLCVHGRDWIAGESIMNQILNSVQSSRRTIIILTKSFVDSEWSRLEFEAAYNQSLSDHVTRVLVVVPGEVPDITNLGPDLSAFITLNTYIKWTEGNFPQKLRCAMPRVRRIMNAT